MKVFTVQLPTPADGDVSTTTIITVTGNFKGSVTHQGFQIVHLWFVIGICVFSFHTPPLIDLYSLGKASGAASAAPTCWPPHTACSGGTVLRRLRSHRSPPPWTRPSPSIQGPLSWRLHPSRLRCTEGWAALALPPPLTSFGASGFFSSFSLLLLCILTVPQAQ